jgi:hypothetical protein
MKKIVLLLMTLAGALTVQGRVHTLQEMAERAYNFLTFEMTDGAKVSIAISSLTLTINGNTLTAGSQTFTLSNLSKMYFSNTDETTGKVNKSYEKNTRAELGLNIKGAINYTYKDFKLQTTLGLYTPYAWDKTRVYEEIATGDMYADLGTGATYPEATYKYLGFRDNNRRFGNFDVDWTVNLSYQFLKCLQVTLSTDLRYYNGVKIANKAGDEAERVQFKGMIGLGVGYSF